MIQQNSDRACPVAAVACFDRHGTKSQRDQALNNLLSCLIDLCSVCAPCVLIRSYGLAQIIIYIFWLKFKLMRLQFTLIYYLYITETFSATLINKFLLKCVIQFLYYAYYGICSDQLLFRTRITTLRIYLIY